MDLPYPPQSLHLYLPLHPPPLLVPPDDDEEDGAGGALNGGDGDDVDAVVRVALTPGYAAGEGGEPRNGTEKGRHAPSMEAAGRDVDSPPATRLREEARFTTATPQKSQRPVTERGKPSRSATLTPPFRARRGPGRSTPDATSMNPPSTGARFPPQRCPGG